MVQTFLKEISVFVPRHRRLFYGTEEQNDAEAQNFVSFNTSISCGLFKQVILSGDSHENQQFLLKMAVA